MNYIKLLNAAFERFYLDERLKPTHISLYMALFQEWNCHRFAEEFSVNRRDLMTVSKIGSKSSYHRCLRDLDDWKYLSYFPSNSPYKGSKIKMSIFCTEDESLEDQNSPNTGQVDDWHRPENEPLSGHYSPLLEQIAERYRPKTEPGLGRYGPTRGLTMGSTINSNKQLNNNKQPKGWQVVIDFFVEKGCHADEGKKFFEHYQNRNWKTSDGNTIRDWRALAKHWMDRAELYKKESKANTKPPSQFKDNLKTTKYKDYGQPL
ncbi:hypothetical protein M8845_12875 [Gelidibacter japonicus]|uniref:hypothetical protein n=1 Tax=Gelidibacter japonicus TaxID=1962232 RepID=UPI00202109B2|nr:hypothetical protein [Gelidibacter japonicus]MCL8008317.1 hypothetical protein [Gelidibacter japonicus]